VKNKISKILILFFFAQTVLFAQEIDVVPELKKIESGEIEDARQVLNELKKTSPNDPSVIFLDAVITEEGESALKKYESVYYNFPGSKYADAALYRIFSYYYALGYYKKAESFKQKLIKEYPDSPYIKAVNRKIPDTQISQTQTETKKAETAVTKKPKTDAATETVYHYTVQAGAFLNLENAKKLRERLMSSGYPVELSIKEVGGTTLNVVTAGKFTDEKSAEDFLIYLDEHFRLKGRIKEIER